MPYNPDIHHRHSIRLPQYDYAQSGVYFVTICVNERECLLGDVVDNRVIPNEYGQIADRIWCDLPDHFPGIAVDPRIIMPNHTHANITIIQRAAPPNLRSGVSSPSVMDARDSLGGATPPLPELSQIIAYYKYQTTKEINQLRGMPGIRFWQRNYWEHIIRNEVELLRIGEYIENNPARWREDDFHPDAPPNPFNRGSSGRGHPS